MVDYGQGLSQDQIKHIMDYSELDRKLFELQNLGIGLLLVKRLVDVHGGELSLTSISGKSTVVELTLPLDR